MEPKLVVLNLATRLSVYDGAESFVSTENFDQLFSPPSTLSLNDLLKTSEESRPSALSCMILTSPTAETDQLLSALFAMPASPIEGNDKLLWMDGAVNSSEQHEGSHVTSLGRCAGDEVGNFKVDDCKRASSTEFELSDDDDGRSDSTEFELRDDDDKVSDSAEITRSITK